MVQLLLRDENTNVNGLVFVIDMTGMQMKHQLFWGPEEIKMRMHLVQVRWSNFEAYVWQISVSTNRSIKWQKQYFHKLNYNYEPIIIIDFCYNCVYFISRGSYTR